MTQRVYFVGSDSEIAHHAAPLLEELRQNFDVEIAPPHVVLNKAQARDVAVFFSEHFDRFRNAVTKLKERNVATLYLIDGILEWRNAWENRADEPACPFAMRPVLSHKVACIGPTQAQTLAMWGNGPKIEIVGIPRLFGNCELKLSIQAKSYVRRQISNLGHDRECPGFTEQQIANATRSLTDLKDWFGKTDRIDDREIEVVWRLTGNLDQAIGVKNELTDVRAVNLRES